MAATQSMRPLAICSRCLKSQSSISLSMRSFSSAPSVQQAAAAAQVPKPTPLVPTSELDPSNVATVSEEQRLIKHRQLYPIGSRRRRAALSSMKDAVPFEQLPYQCFQEARNVLSEDREEKIAQISKMRKRIANLEATDAAAAGGEPHKQHRLFSMRNELENLKILADINDPMVKKRFEDGLGDMNKPIYRYLANKKWREMKRKILMQRITQMSVVPDVLPEIDPTIDVDLIWHRRVVEPGTFVPSNWSAKAPSLRIQKFDKGEGYYTVVAVDSDVPNVETDSFDVRCHGIWSGFKISATDKEPVTLGGKAAGSQQMSLLPWQVPYAQKGSPYHRISLWVFEHTEQKCLLSDKVKEMIETGDSSTWLRGFVEKTDLKPVGVTMFRTQWDDSMARVMKRNNIPGAELEFRRRKPERLPDKYQVKDGLRYRGWRK